MQACRFEPSLLTENDFQRCAVAAVRGVAKRQTEHLAGRICARAALHQLTGTPSMPSVGDEGVPLWPETVVGSITHGAGMALAIAAFAHHYQGLGIDIEQLLSPQRADRLAAQIHTPEELERRAQRPISEHALCTSLTFSIKESLFKALYPIVGQRFYFHDAEVLHWDFSGRVHLRLLLDLNEQWPAGKEIEGQYSLYQQHLLSLVAVK